ncbi:hypothetical protein [Algibacter mikhailovii]|uniref:hypothetical protein n=1 Tax=Algibacter mikhailovii TaxID=425498 RepID=UPI0024951B43|nr:hypothetical protein [Algibacter mikhailovii]
MNDQVFFRCKILEEYSKKEVKITPFHKFGRAVLFLMILLFLIQFNYPEVLVNLDFIFLLLAPLMITILIAPFFLKYRREINEVGELIFYEDYLIINDEKYNYKDLNSFNFTLTDYFGKIKWMRFNYTGRSQIAQGGNNYFQHTYNGLESKYRIRLESKRDYDFIENLERLINSKINPNYAIYQ